MKVPFRKRVGYFGKRKATPERTEDSGAPSPEGYFVLRKKAASGTDKGRRFEQILMHPTARSLIGPSFGKVIAEEDRSGVVARAFRTASEQTGAFEARDAKK